MKICASALQFLIRAPENENEKKNNKTNVEKEKLWKRIDERKYIPRWASQFFSFVFQFACKLLIWQDFKMQGNTNLRHDIVYGSVFTSINRPRSAGLWYVCVYGMSGVCVCVCTCVGDRSYRHTKFLMYICSLNWMQQGGTAINSYRMHPAHACIRAATEPNTNEIMNCNFWSWTSSIHPRTHTHTHIKTVIISLQLCCVHFHWIISLENGSHILRKATMWKQARLPWLGIVRKNRFFVVVVIEWLSRW